MRTTYTCSPSPGWPRELTTELAAVIALEVASTNEPLRVVTAEVRPPQGAGSQPARWMADNYAMDCALAVIDMQRDVMATCPAAQSVLTTVNGLIAGARRGGIPVVFVRQHDAGLPAGSEGWQLDSRLDYREGDIVVEKTFRDGFAATVLDDVLRRLGASRLVITGAHSDYCIQATAVSALAHGYDITLVADGHATEPTTIAGHRLDAATVSELVNARMATLRYPDRRVEVLPAAKITFDLLP
jgi:nicotinamidase-related amidase